MLDSDEVDNVTLQARIDLSMAYAHELVTSWIKPSLIKAASKPHKDTDKELEEYMRRPPRLGVGAPIPESASLSRETIRLKGRLTNKSEKKRAREEELGNDGQVSDDEEESRAGAIKKKVKLDVFGGNKKKKGGEEITGPSEARGSASMGDQGTEVREDAKDPFDISIVSTPGKKKKKRKKIREPGSLLRLPSPPSSPELSSPDGPNGWKREQVELPQTPPLATSPPVKQNGSTGRSRAEAIDISLILASPSSLHYEPHASGKSSQFTEALKMPLLNLTGPPVIQNSEGDEQTPRSPKKKRKKRKRKKSSFANTTMDTTG